MSETVTSNRQSMNLMAYLSWAFIIKLHLDAKGVAVTESGPVHKQGCLPV